MVSKDLMPTSELDGQLGQVVAQAKSKAPQDFIGKIKFYAQTGWLIFSICTKSLATHSGRSTFSRTLDKTLCEQGSAIRTIFAAASTIRDSYARMGIKGPSSTN